MTDNVIQKAFHTGEWATQLNARVDLAKYHTGAALLRNWCVNYHGGADTRMGTKFLAQAQPSTTVRLIGFQASFDAGYILEFGEQYIRFYFHGAIVLSGGVPYVLASPYTAADLALLKFAQNVNTMVLCHPSYPPYMLTLNSANNWTITKIVIGTTIGTPTGLASTTTLGAGNVNYSYVVTAVDANGQESGSSSSTNKASLLDLRTTGGTISITWNAVSGALSYNVYKAELSYSGAVPSGAVYGYIGNTRGLQFDDSNIPPNFSLTPPIAQNPFSGGSVDSVTITNAGLYTTAPSIVFAAAPGGLTATGTAFIGLLTLPILAAGNSYNIGDLVTLTNGIQIQITGISGPGHVTTFNILFAPAVAGAIAADPQTMVSTDGSGTGLQCNSTWGVKIIQINNAGAGYLVAPAITFSAGAGAATATISDSSAGNPAVPTYFQQRLGLLGPPSSPQEFDFSQPGSYFNFNVSDPIQEDDAIRGQIVSGQLNEIKSAVSMPSGLAVFTNKALWLLNGGAAGAPITPAAIVANANSYIGASDVPPIVANANIVYVQSKGSIVRDATFDFYKNIFTGTDITIMSTHLFNGFTIREMAWAEEPYKIIWAIRDDGEMLSCSYMKEQEVVGWSHHDTAGQFLSVATVTEPALFGNTFVDAVYVAVQRLINSAVVIYIERMVDRVPLTSNDRLWSVDAGIQYNGAPATHFTGATHLAGAQVTGLADGVPITPFTMAVGGAFNLATPASIVTVGIAYTPQLQTLALDIGEPTIQGKDKKIAAVTVRCQETLGLTIGRSFGTLVRMKDLTLGNIGSCTNELVTGLVTGDARTIVDPLWDEIGQFCIQQSYPYPASVLGVIPEIVVGDK